MKWKKKKVKYFNKLQNTINHKCKENHFNIVCQFTTKLLEVKS